MQLKSIHFHSKNFLLYQCTNLLISNLSGPDQVTTYNIAYRYLSVSMMLYSILLSPLWPAFTDAYVKKDFAWMNRVYRRMCKVYLMSVVLLFLLVVFSPFVYQIWIGDKVEIPWEMTVLVALYMAIHSWDLLQVELINGVGAVKLQTYVTLVGLCLHIPLAFLIGRYWGALGVVSSMIVINIVYVSCFTTQVHKLLTQKAQGTIIQSQQCHCRCKMNSFTRISSVKATRKQRMMFVICCNHLSFSRVDACIFG